MGRNEAIVTIQNGEMIFCYGSPGGGLPLAFQSPQPIQHPGSICKLLDADFGALGSYTFERL